MSENGVVIVGAGVAGLCCGLELKKRGIPFQILEASDGPGGRVRTDVVDGFRLDRGFQILLTAYPEAKRVLDYDALDLEPFFAGAFIWRNGKLVRFADPFRNRKEIWGALTAPIGKLMDRPKLLRLRNGLKKIDADAVSDAPGTTSTAQYLRDQGFSADMIEAFFKPFYSGVFLETELATSADFFRFTFHMFSKDNGAVPAMGMGAIAQQLADGLPEGSIEYGSSVSQVRADGVTLTGGRSVTGKVVLAVDGGSAAQLLEQAPPRINTVRNLYFAADHPPIAKPALVLTPDCEWVNNLHVVSNVAPQCAPDGKALISVSVVRPFEGSDAELEDKVRRDLTPVLGEMVANWRLLRIYRIAGALPQTSAADAARLREAAAGKGIALCGDYLGVPSLNNAMRSGRLVAEQIAG